MIDIEIGTRFYSHGKSKAEYEVIDIYKTYNISNELVHTSYVAKSIKDFLGQVVTWYDIPATTIIRNKKD